MVLAGRGRLRGLSARFVRDKKARGSAPGPRWGLRPQTPFFGAVAAPAWGLPTVIASGHTLCYHDMITTGACHFRHARTRISFGVRRPRSLLRAGLLGEVRNQAG